MEATGPCRQTPIVMTQLEIELQALRRRRRSTGLVAGLRSHRPFDRRAIREPDARDEYWVRVQKRLVESDAAFLTRYDPYGSQDSTAAER
jgi:hypothetical protein